MGQNIGAGETLKAWLVKSKDIEAVDSLVKDTSVKDVIHSEYTQGFNYRTLNTSEMTYQPISNWLKGRYDKTMFTSDTSITPKERDKVLFEDGTFLRITRVLPQKQNGFFMFSKKFPNILELE
jgi:hypothetical protein